jgi:hypothetical protein
VVPCRGLRGGLPGVGLTRGRTTLHRYGQEHFAALALIGWSNGMSERAGEDNHRRRVRIADELGIRMEV